jgi:uncharacterized protein
MATPTHERIRMLDSLRGVALLGILLMNILWFGLPEKAVEDLGVRGEYSGPNFWAWWLIEAFFHGTMRGLFSMLFGASAILILEQYTKKSDFGSASELYFRRLLVLFVFGLFNAYILLWPGDILYTYALAGMFIFPLHRLPVKRLLIIAGAAMLISGARTTWQHDKPVRLKMEADKALAIDTTVASLTTAQQADIAAWKAFEEEQNLEQKRLIDAEQIACTQGDFWTFFFYSASITRFLETEFVYDFFFLDAFTFMLIGIALYRLGIITGKKSTRFYIVLGIIGYAVGLPIYYSVAQAKLDCGFNPYCFGLHETFHWHQFGRLGLTLGNISLLYLLFRLPLTSWIGNLMSPVGRMAFTNYLMQSIIGAIIFSGFAMGMFNKLQRYELYYVVGCIWVFQIIFSHLWMRIYTVGPFEWLWRSATHGEWQKFERVNKLSE